jgi:hypothetical protein
MVDLRGEGLACYYKQPDESDLSRQRVIIATLAGFMSEKRFRREHSYPARDELGVLFSPDQREARKLLMELAGDYSSNEHRLNSQLEHLIERHWLAIEALATALLAKEPEPLKLLKSGGTWSHETTAKYVVGDEVVRILERYGIEAVCKLGLCDRTERIASNRCHHRLDVVSCLTQRKVQIYAPRGTTSKSIRCQYLGRGRAESSVCL